MASSTKTKSVTATFSREEEMAEPIARFLRNRAFRVQSSEVPFYEHRVDVYGYSRKGGLTIAIELKLVAWTRAVEQALLYQLCSDLVYIAMPSDQVRRVDVRLLLEHGLGLISVEPGRCREIVPANRSPVVREHYRAECVAYLRGER